MFRRFLSIIMVSIMIVTQCVDVAKAAFDEEFYSGNQIFYYDPTCSTKVSEGYITLEGKDNLEKILQFFIKKGLTLAQASGIAGNMMVESGLDPTIIQGGGHARPNTGYRPSVSARNKGFGLVQWTSYNRQVNLEKHIYGDGVNRGLGVDITDLSAQLSFAWHELSTDYSSTLAALKATDDPVQAAVIVHDGYEKSADSRSKVVTVRGGNAKKFYDTYVDQPAIAGPSSGDQPDGDNLSDPAQLMSARNPENSKGDNCIAGDVANGDLRQLVLAYAWPQYAVRTDQMPAYTDAVTQARSENRYVGGKNGNDCGAFVTLLVRNSGFDPGYNSNGFGGNTVHQESWASKNWRRLTPEEEASADKQPGDVAINYTHTYIYVGDIDGFGSKIASASLGGPQRSPMAGHESPTDRSFRWYRKVGPGQDIAVNTQASENVNL